MAANWKACGAPRPRAPTSSAWIAGVNDFWVAKGNAELTDFNYAAETYDAVIVIALAAEVGRDRRQRRIADEIVGVTRDGEKCTDFADCMAIIEAGGDPDYDGISGPHRLQRQRRAARGQLRRCSSSAPTTASTTR